MGLFDKIFKGIMGDSSAPQQNQQTPQTYQVPPDMNGAQAVNTADQAKKAGDFAKAAFFYDVAAQKGNFRSWYELGCFYSEGRGVPQNHEKAFSCFETAVQKGVKDAIYKLGECYYFGRGTQLDMHKAVHWLRRAYLNGSAAAAFLIAQAFMGGDGFPCDYPVSKMWFQRAAAKGHSAGAEMDRKLSGFPAAADDDKYLTAEDCMVLYRHYNGLNNMRMKTKYLEMAAKQNHADAQRQLADVYRGGEGVRQDFEKVRYWLERAVENQDAKAMCELAGLYEHPVFGSIDHDKAMQYYRQAAALGHKDAHLFIQNIEAKKGPVYAKSADDADSFVRFAGEAMKAGQRQLAFYYRERAARMGHVDSQRSVGLMLHEADCCMYNPTLSVFWLARIALNHKNKYGFAILGRYLEYGSGMRTNRLLALDFYRNALSLKHSWSEGYIKSLEEDLARNPEDIPYLDLTMDECYAKAQELENANQYMSAYQYNYSAAMRGHAQAQNNVGFYYCNGLIGAPDYPTAMLWYILAASKGNAAAMYNIAYMFENGKGMDPDIEIARAYYTDALNRGFAMAENALAQLDAPKGTSQAQNSAEPPAPQDAKEKTETAARTAPQPNEEKKKPEQKGETTVRPPLDLETLPPNLDGYFKGVIGMEAVKQQLEKIYQFVKVQIRREAIMRARSAEPVQTSSKSYNFVLLGNPGTGKTTVARIIAEILYDLHLRENNDTIEVDRSHLVGAYIGDTESKTRAVLESARGGTLFIDEAYSLYREDAPNDFGREAIDTLMKDMEDHRDNYSVIIAGYKNEMMNMIKNANPGFQSRFNYTIEIPDYTDEELVKIAHAFMKKQNYTADGDVDAAIVKWIHHERVDDKFGNARAMRELVEHAIENQAARLSVQADVEDDAFFMLRPEDFWQGAGDEKTTEEYLAELNSLIGLQSVKDEVNTLLDRIAVNEVRENRGLKNSSDFGTLHMAFKGNAGTGKTTVARLIGKLYASMGVLKRADVFVECSRATLVGQYQGHTAANVKKTVQSALGGILFVDEAYSLVQNENDSFGREAVDTLVAEMENNRDSLVVIFAGYSDDLDRFFENNQGLRSRVPIELVFEDYTLDELFQVLQFMLKKKHLTMTEEAAEAAKVVIAMESAQPNFGNARGVRNLADKISRNLDTRIAAMSDSDALPDEALTTIEKVDVEAMI
ncbi:MAG: AAA family ATPase [Oscillospiraceae bacterium]|nr:AAA family ATPase [Oscillospiraceae bacterium]